MFAFARAWRSVAIERSRDSELEIAQEEAALEVSESCAQAQIEEAGRRGARLQKEWSAARGVLEAMKRTRALPGVDEALARFPSLAISLVQEPKAERAEALEARRAAIAARRGALEAAERYLSRRGDALAAAAASLEAMRESVARLQDEAARHKGVAEANAQQVAEQRAKCEEARRKEASARAPRARPARVRLETEVSLSSDSNFYQGFSANISDGGLFVATYQLLEVGDEVDLAFILPGDRTIEAKGVVRWTREHNDATPDLFPGMGIEFVEMGEATREAVESFVAEREPMFWA